MHLSSEGTEVILYVHVKHMLFYFGSMPKLPSQNIQKARIPMFRKRAVWVVDKDGWKEWIGLALGLVSSGPLDCV